MIEAGREILVEDIGFGSRSRGNRAIAMKRRDGRTTFSEFFNKGPEGFRVGRSSEGAEKPCFEESDTRNYFFPDREVH